MNSIKCATCGLVLWANAENCKRCGATLNPQAEAEHSSQANAAFADTTGPGGTLRRKRKRSPKLSLLVAVAVLIMLALPVTWLVVRALNADQPTQELILNNGKKVTARIWFHRWFASDPSGDEIFDHYLKVSGWQDHSQELNSYIANGPFEIRNDATETAVRMNKGPFQGAWAHFHWTTCGGNVELKGLGPDKLLITQQYSECGSSRTWQRGTNGGTAWSRKGRRPQDSKDSSEPEPSAELADIYSGLADLKRGAEFVNYLQLQTRHSGLLLSGKSMVGDRVCYEVQSKTGSAPAEVMYFDVETGMLLKFDHYRAEFPYLPMFDEYTTRQAPASPLAETYLEDYRDVSGVQIPFLVRQHLQNFWITMTISEFKGNAEITSPEFNKPAKDAR